MSRRDPLDLQGQAADELDAKKRERLVLRQQEDDLRWLMGDARGRRVMARILGVAGIQRQSFNTDPLVMACNEGQRAVGLQLSAWLQNASAKNYLTMLSEHAASDRRDDESGA